MSTILAYTIDEACRVARIGRTTIYKAIATGELVARKYGRKTLILATDLHRFIENLPTIKPKPNDQIRLSETIFIISANSANSAMH